MKQEENIIRELLAGEPDKLIAWHLGLTEGTVKMYLYAIRKKYKCRNRTELAMKFLHLRKENDETIATSDSGYCGYV